MRVVQVSSPVRLKLADLHNYLILGLHLSEDQATRYMDRIDHHLGRLCTPISHAPCRFRRWRQYGWRCTSLDGWVFAYEVFSKGVLVRDMAHSATLWDVD